MAEVGAVEWRRLRDDDGCFGLWRAEAVKHRLHPDTERSHPLSDRGSVILQKLHGLLMISLLTRRDGGSCALVHGRKVHGWRCRLTRLCQRLGFCWDALQSSGGAGKCVRDCGVPLRVRVRE